MDIECQIKIYINDTRNANKGHLKLIAFKTKLSILGILTTPFSPFNPKTTALFRYNSSSGQHIRKGLIFGTTIVQATICSPMKFNRGSIKD